MASPKRRIVSTKDDKFICDFQDNPCPAILHCKKVNDFTTDIIENHTVVNIRYLNLFCANKTCCAECFLYLPYKFSSVLDSQGKKLSSWLCPKCESNQLVPEVNLNGDRTIKWRSIPWYGHPSIQKKRKNVVYEDDSDPPRCINAIPTLE